MAKLNKLEPLAAERAWRGDELILIEVAADPASPAVFIADNLDRGHDIDVAPYQFGHPGDEIRLGRVGKNYLSPIEAPAPELRNYHLVDLCRAAGEIKSRVCCPLSGVKLAGPAGVGVRVRCPCRAS